MVNYSTLQAAIDAGKENMTTLRSGYTDCDDSFSYNTEINWFKFEGEVVSKVYISDYGYFGISSDRGTININNRDGCLLGEYRELGEINGIKFCKFKVESRSYYSNSSTYQTDAYHSYYDIFFFENGIIYLNWYEVPSQYFSGNNRFTCNEVTDNFSVTSGTPCEYYWVPQNSEGTAFNNAVAGKPNLSPAPPGPSPEPAPDPDIEYNFELGTYRVKLRSSYKILNGTLKHKDSKPFQFNSIAPPLPGDEYTFITNQNIKIETDNCLPIASEYFDPTIISETGESNGLEYTIYDGKLCIITGNQTSEDVPSLGYPWWPDYPEVYPNLVIYADANFISLKGMFQQNSSGATQMQITFGKNAHFANPINCDNAFGCNASENPYESYLEVIDNISGEIIHVSSVYNMFSGITFELNPDSDDDYIKINNHFWNTLDFSACTSLARMFAQNRFGHRYIDFSQHDLSNVTDIYYMFYNANLDDLDFGPTFIEANVHNIRCLFSGEMNSCRIDSFRLRSVITDMDYLFGNRLGGGSSNLEFVDLGAPEVAQSSAPAAYAFYHCYNLKRVILTNQRISVSYSDRATMFNGDSNIERIDCPYSTSTNITLPKTMYDMDGNSYNTLPGNNNSIFADETDAPDWFNFTDDQTYVLTDDDGNIINISGAISYTEVKNGNKKYKVYNEQFIVSNNDNIVYPSAYADMPKWTVYGV